MMVLRPAITKRPGWSLGWRGGLVGATGCSGGYGGIVMVFLGVLCGRGIENRSTHMLKDALTSAVDCSREAVRLFP